MSRLIFFGSPYHGHTNPTLRLVKELISNGEEIIYFSIEELRSKIEDTGAQYCNYRYLEENKKMWEPSFTQILKMREKQDISFLMEECEWDAKICKAVMEDIVNEVIGKKPDYIMHDAEARWGKGLARCLDIPAISSITTFAYCNRMLEMNPEFVIHHLFNLKDQYVMDPCSTIKMINRMSKFAGKRYGMEKYQYLEDYCNLEELNIVYTSEYFQPFMECFDDSFKFVGPSMYETSDTTGFPYERIDKRPLIYISLGTVVSRQKEYDDFYRRCFAAFGNSDRQVVLGVGEKINIESIQDKIPDNFIVRNYVPQVEILQRADLLITHGGMNSVNEALYYGVPLIVIPQIGDQFWVASRVEELNTGIYIRDFGFSISDLRNAAEKIFSEKKYYKNSESAGKTFKSAGSYKKAAEEIWKFKQMKGIQ